jgi:hypothetical protein
MVNKSQQEKAQKKKKKLVKKQQPLALKPDRSIHVQEKRGREKQKRKADNCQKEGGK